jgi:putative MATE family efflux protein
MVSFSLYNLINTFWVARLGYQAVAAVTVIMPFFVLAIAVGVGTGIGINALASRRFGERNTSAPNYIAGQTFTLTLVLGLLFLIITNLFPHQILVLCGATPDVMELGEQYLRVMGWGMPSFLFGMGVRNLFHAFGDTLRPMVFNISSNVINAVLDPFLIFGIGFFPELGVAGAALASIISASISAVLYFWFIVKGKTAYRINFHYLKPDFQIIKDIYRVGLPSFFMDATESIVFAIYLHIAAGYGSVVLAASGIAIRICDLAFMPIVGTAQGLLPIIGFSLGAGLYHRLWKAVKTSAVWVFFILLGVSILLIIFTPQILMLFKPNPELLEVAIPGMRIFCSSLALIGPTIMIITTFQGLSKGKSAWILSLVRQLVFLVPGLYIFPYFFGLTGVWLAMPVSDTLAFIVVVLWLYREYHIHVKKGYLSKADSAVSGVGEEIF